MSRPAAPSLPSRNGVGPSCVSLPPASPGRWPTIADFLVYRFPAIDRSVWLARMAAQLVIDEFGQAVTPTRPYQGHIRIYYYRALAVELRIPFEETVLYQDAHLVVADKPHFLPVTPSGHYLQETLLVRLKTVANPDRVPSRIARECHCQTRSPTKRNRSQRSTLRYRATGWASIFQVPHKFERVNHLPLRRAPQL